LTGHSNVITSLAVLKDGSLVSGSFDQTIRTWISDYKNFKITKTENNEEPID